MTERTTIRFPGELLTKAKRKAAAEGRTLTSLIEDAVRRDILENPDVSSSKRIMPRVSTATGGFNPGFENMTYSQMQELDDIEYVERLKNGFE